ncbi:MAG: hypothetical protein ACREQA_16570 [Candidatus Binatia bacterium]
MGRVTYTAFDILNSIGASYASLNVAIAASKEKEEWQGAVAVLSFSHLSPKDLERLNANLRAQFEPPDSQEFKVLHAVFPAAQGRDLLLQVAEVGKLRLSDLEVSLPQWPNLAGVKSYINPRPSHYRGEGSEFPTFELAVGEHPKSLYRPEVNRIAESHGYGDIYTAIRALLRIDLDASTGYEFLLALPIYARIDNPRWDPAQGIRFDLVRHESISNLSAQVLLSSRDFLSGRKDLKQKAQASRLGTLPLGKAFLSDDSMAAMPEASLADVVCIRLVHRELAELQTEERRLGDYLPVQERNPLAAVLSLFCEQARFEHHFTQPQYEFKKKDVGRGFERSVSWLLSCAGFSTLWLGKDFENLREIESQAHLGSVDIVACHFQKKVLLLVGCTTGVPAHTDIDNLQNLGRELQRRALGRTTYAVKTVIFTSTANLPAISDLANKAGVHLFDSDVLRRLSGEVHGGHTENFLLHLGIPPYL